jgi:Tfp pilus assembly protein FimT
MAALGLTFAGAVLAIRGIPWFALSCLVLVPVALGPALEARTKRMPRAFDRGLSYGAVAVLALVAILALARDDSWYLKNWPEGAVTAVRNSLATPETRAFATSRDADWILWSIPELRGRLAYDVRFEIYDRETFERIVRFRGEQGDDWKSLADGYQVVVFETHQEPSSHVDDFLAEGDARTVYADERVTVIQRRAPS